MAKIREYYISLSGVTTIYVPEFSMIQYTGFRIENNTAKVCLQIYDDANQKEKIFAFTIVDNEEMFEESWNWISTTVNPQGIFKHLLYKHVF